MSKPIFIAGSAITNFGELWDKSLEDLLREASARAIENAQLDFSDIDAIFVANMGAGAFEGQMHLGALVSSWFPQHPPAMRVEGACASGGLALVAAATSLLADQYQTVLVVGAEKMTDVNANQATEVLAGAAHVQQEWGSTFPALYAILAKQHQQAYGTKREQLSAVSVKNHFHALDNPHAQYHKEFSLEQVSRSALVADPLRILDCSPLSDGAAAVVLSSKKTAKPQAKIVAHAQAMDTLNLHDRETLTSLPATVKAAKKAWQLSGWQPSDVEVAEVHDCFTIAELIALEDLGFFKPGEAGAATLKGQTTHKGQVVVNPSGGLKASGHPVGATGIKQVAYLAGLLEAGKFKRALAHNVGGSGATAVVHLLEAIEAEYARQQNDIKQPSNAHQQSEVSVNKRNVKSVSKTSKSQPTMLLPQTNNSTHSTVIKPALGEENR